MSKSLGNGVDPFDMVEKYGADSLRYYLTTDGSMGLDLRFDEVKLTSTWNFVNKIWNASRFVLMNIEDLKEIKFESLKSEDKWILSKFEKLVKTVTKHMDKYEFNLAGKEIYDFAWSYFCDYYIEIAKFSLDDNNTKSVLCYVLEGILKLLHPFMPFVTEEIYQMLPVKDSESIMISEYPKYDKKLVFKEEEVIDDDLEFIKNFRNVKAENNIGKELKVLFDGEVNDLVIKMLKLQEAIISDKLDIKSYRVVSNSIKATIYFEKEESDEDKALREKEIESLKASIQRRENLLANPNYVNKAPQNIVELDRVKLAEEKRKLEELLK